MEKSTLLKSLEQAVLQGDQSAAVHLAEQALASGLSALETIEQGCVPGVQEAGARWEEGDYFLPELVTSAQAMKAALAVLQPALQQEGTAQRAALGRVVIGTVQGDIHDIGKTLVATVLAANGFLVSDEGADVPVARFVERARALDADIICASALLTTTMVMQRELVAAVREAGLRSAVMVGGAPVTRAWAEEIGAAGHADNAIAAVALARRLVGHAPA